MVGPEVHVTERSIHEALINDAYRPKLVETLPDWMNRDAIVRFGDRDIQLESAKLPRLDGIMGTAHLLRQGQKELLRPLRTPADKTDEQKQAGALLIKSILELAGIAAGTAAAKKGKGKNALLYLGGLGLALTGGAGLTLDLASCAPAQVTEVPPGTPTALPATEISPQVTVTPLSNEVVVGTPSAAPETPAPIVGASYPSEVSTLESPLVYSYGGEAGRQNMNEYTRQLFDRYVAEMSRSGFLTGTSVDQLYRSFDQGYDFKLFTTDQGLTWLVQSKSDGSFLVPKDENDQIFRDLQLPYDYLFQQNQAVDVGNDNFDLQRFQANKVGFVGAWPVLVTVDGQGVPVSWVNMEQGGAITPITVASTTEIAPTVASDARLELTVGAETFRVTTDVLYSEAVTNVNIDPAKAQMIGDVLVYTDATGRLLWNEHMQAWVPEFGTNMDYAHPELSPSVPLEAYYDGSKPGDPMYIPSSVALSDALYVAEHPGLIAPDATHPYYRVALAVDETGPNGYYITLTGPNQYLLTDQNTTYISRKENKPFAYFGMQQTSDANGNIIYIVKRASWNPTAEDPNGIVTMSMGFDKAQYEGWIRYPLIFKFLNVDAHPPGELLPVFPYEYNAYRFSPDTFSYRTDKPNPNVAALLNIGMISMFEPGEQQNIKNLINGYNIPFDAKTNPGSYLLSSLPPELSNMILFTGVQSWQ